MISSPSPDANPPIEELLNSFSKGSARQRRTLLDSIEARSNELAALGCKALIPFDPNGDDWAAGWVLQVLQRHQSEAINNILPGGSKGWLNAPSSCGIDFSPLQEELLKENFESADRFTSSTLRKLAGEEAESRGYVYYSEVQSIPSLDLASLDRLWKVYSQGKFGFSIQAKLLSSLNGRYDRLWKRIGWKNDGVWTRYPSAFDWSLNAPEGHMPLTNQLRGVRLLHALLNHPGLLERT